MAFQHVQHRPAPQRQAAPQPSADTHIAPQPVYKRAADEEWILFSPQSEKESFSCTSQTPRTATHLSDFGSLETHIRSQPRADSRDTDSLAQHAADFDDDNAELDSLDDGLHAFHHPFSASSHHALDQSGGAVLPTHDGFGGFPSATGLQEHLWQFEQHNPHRRPKLNRRHSSMQRRLDAQDQEPEALVEDDRTARIEKWRLEQSKAVLEEIERETRRRRRRTARRNSEFLDENEGTQRRKSQPSESFWRRITHVISDLIGLDQSTLSVIFGEEFVDLDSSPTPTVQSPIAAAAAQESRVTFRSSESGWESRLLERFARELGVLVHQLAEHDGAAFSTYRNIIEQEPEYAGLSRNSPRPVSLRQRTRLERQRNEPAVPAVDASFTPTVPQPTMAAATEHTDTSLWGIEEEPEQTAEDPEAEEREYWEKEVDVNMVFNFLKNRFSIATNPDDIPSTDGPLPASWATSGGDTSIFGSSPESFRRAEAIRKQHPLVSRAAAAQTRRRESILRRHHIHQAVQRRSGSSSCASQSTKRSRRTRSGSSRHFWDLGGSVASVGSGAGMASPVGGWGEI